MKKLLYLASLCLFSLQVLAQTDLQNPLPMDPQVKVGQLANGLRYYIRHNEEPKNRAQLRLVVHAGSVLETEDELGLAHFLEHMQFNGTKNFPKNELVDFLQKAGLKFGADLNAYTGFDETVYMLPVPTDTLDKFEKFFLVLSDWANKASLDHEEIDKERGVVLEESRLGKGAQSRIRDQLIPAVLAGSQYAHRLPIGTDENLKNFDYSSIENFHKKWYRPDLEAIVAVGDFDVKMVEGFIQKYFASIPAGSKSPERTEYKIPIVDSTNAVVITDKEQPYTLVQVYNKVPQLLEKTGADRLRQTAYSLFNTMMSTRLQELLQKADPPFQFGLSNYGGFLGDVNALTVLAVAKDNNIERALKAVMDENQRAEQFGFTQSELDRAKNQYMSGLEKQFNEKDKTNSQAFVSELTSCFLDNVPMTSIEFDLDFAKKHLNEISLSEINALVKELFKSQSRTVVLLAPESAKAQLPSEKQLIAWVNDKNTEITAYVDDAANEPLMKEEPKAGKVLSTKHIEALGISALSLSNGIKVVLKPTDFKNDEILINATSKGGSNLYEDNAYDDASVSSVIAQVSGLGNFSNIQLLKYLSDKISRVSVYVGENTEGLSASSAAKDLETTFQQIHLRFTTHRFDNEAVTGFLNNQKDAVRALNATPTPEKVFNDTLQLVMGNYSYRAEPISVARIEGINPEKALHLYADRFADANDFIFTIVGSFEEKEIIPLIEKYIASLPVKDSEENYVIRPNNPPTGQIEKTVHKGSEDKASVVLNFTGTYDGSKAEKLQINAVANILGLKLIEKLREEESGVYSPRVVSNVEEFPEARYVVTVRFACAPANVDKLIGITMQEIEKIKKQGAEESDIEKYVAEEKLDIQEALKTNRFWSNTLSVYTLNEENLDYLLKLEEHLNQISVKSTQKAAESYLSGKNLIKAVLLPE
ncbi:insulinase family protein [Marinilongibacter aquaticus]|uniref:M16 family metallopeptidase n=1 Tax=Marinilongibacter aquaticus TaxID=2975157 RepID=UPI0021BD0840|nr:M16 family metallopeptidase [Marinilongibacter aquaticus]UBM58047.1 insulinase family protein [Marinilongibacter aquaticus]